MRVETVLEIVSNALTTIIYVSAPPLLSGLVVGLIISIFQAVTSIQEQTLAFVPKILAVFIAILVFGSFMFTTTQNFAVNLIKMIPELLTSR